jgi:hypothetical protein
MGTRPAAAPGLPQLRLRQQSYAFRAGQARTAAEAAPSRDGPADMLTKQLEALDKAGKSDDEKKPVVEQLLKIKLASELQGLAEKVAKEGTDGNLTVGKIQVKAGRLEIRVQLTAASDEVLTKLKKLGFKELARAKSVNLLIGTIDVKQLEALAKLPEVRRIDPSS